MPATVKVDLTHLEFCLPQTSRGDGDQSEPRIEQYRVTGADNGGRERTLIVTRCLECGAARYTDPNTN